MLEQPSFGRRLKQLRQERGLSQAALAGEEISTGYLSRLESGSRHPTERVVAYLAEKLGVGKVVFEMPPGGGSLAQALSMATSTESDEAIECLAAVLDRVKNEDPLLRWQALWLLGRHRRLRGEHIEEQEYLEELARIADDLALPELQCRAWASLARCLRSTGEVPRAIGIAMQAYHRAKDAKLSVSDTGRALQILVSVEAEAGRLPDARAHVDELVSLVEQGGSQVLRTEALWSAATVRLRQGDRDSAREFLERALEELDSHIDLTLWVRLRLAATSLYLQIEPPVTERGSECLLEAEAALPFVSTLVLRQEALMLRAYLAFQEGRFEDARAAHDELNPDDVRLTYRDRIRLNILDSQLLILEGHRGEGLRRLKELGEQAQQATSIDLAADIWRILAEALEDAHQLRTTPDS